MKRTGLERIKIISFDIQTSNRAVFSLDKSKTSFLLKNLILHLFYFTCIFLIKQL